MGPPTHPTLHTYRILLDIQTSRQSTLFQCLSTVVRWWAIFGPLLLGAEGEAMSRKLWQNFRIKSFAFQTALFGNHHRTSVGDFRQTVELESTRTKYAPLWAHVPSMYPCVHGFTKDGKFGNKTLNRIDFCTPKIILIKILPSSFFSANFEEGNFHVSSSNVPEEQGIYKNGPNWGNVLTFPSSDISPAIWWSLLYVKPQEVVLDLGRSAGQWCIMECILLTLTGPLGGPRSLRPGIRQPSDG